MRDETVKKRSSIVFSFIIFFISYKMVNISIIVSLAILVIIGVTVIILWQTGAIFGSSNKTASSPSPSESQHTPIEVACTSIGTLTQKQTLTSGNGLFGSHVSGTSDASWIITGDSADDPTLPGYNKLVVFKRETNGEFPITSSEEFKSPDGRPIGRLFEVTEINKDRKYVALSTFDSDFKLAPKLVVYKTSSNKVFTQAILDTDIDNMLFVTSMKVDKEYIYVTCIDSSQAYYCIKYKINDDDTVSKINTLQTDVLGGLLSNIRDHTMTLTQQKSGDNNIRVYSRSDRDSNFTFSHQISAPTIEGVDNIAKEFGASSIISTDELTLHISSIQANVSSVQKAGIVMTYSRPNKDSEFTYVQNSWFSTKGKSGGSNDIFGISMRMFGDSNKLFIPSGSSILNVKHKINIFKPENKAKTTFEPEQTLEGLSVSGSDIGTFGLGQYHTTESSDGKIIIVFGQSIASVAGSSGNKSTLFIYEASCL